MSIGSIGPRYVVVNEEDVNVEAAEEVVHNPNGGQGITAQVEGGANGFRQWHEVSRESHGNVRLVGCLAGC